MLKLLPILMLILGVAAGAGAGLFLTPKPDPDASESAEVKEEDNHEDPEGETASSEYVKLNNQFVVPIVQEERVASLVVMSLSIETSVPMSEVVASREPKLRDAFLRVLFDHANMGGFNGSFTKSEMLQVLRDSLADVATRELGPDVKGVLITDISRQDT